MTTPKPGKGISLADLNQRQNCETPFEFEYMLPGARPSGIFLSVLGGQSETVTNVSNAMVNERRRQQAAREAQAGQARPEDLVTPVEDDIQFGQRLSAVRLIGWRTPDQTEGLTPDQLERFQGIEEGYTPELALQLCRSNADLAKQCLDRSNDMGNFPSASRKA